MAHRLALAACWILACSLTGQSVRHRNLLLRLCRLTIKIVSGVEQSGIPDTIGWTKPLSGSYGDSIERLSPIKCFHLSTMVAPGQLNRILATIWESF